MEGTNSSFAFINSSEYLHVTNANVISCVKDVCVQWYRGVYVSYYFLFVMIIVKVLAESLNNHYPKLFKITIKEKKLSDNKILKAVGLGKISANSTTLFNVIANIAEKSMWFRIIQIFFVLKFQYHYL